MAARFTLADPSCTTPGCVFREGGKAGDCSNAAGILTVAEIGRIVEENNLTPQYDEKAAVKWVAWDNDQWVSYDDEDTLVQKKDYATAIRLTGPMVWAIDQCIYGASNNQLVGGRFIALAMKSSVEEVKAYQDYLDAGESCYVSFCGESCRPGFFSEA